MCQEGASSVVTQGYWTPAKTLFVYDIASNRWHPQGRHADGRGLRPARSDRGKALMCHAPPPGSGMPARFYLIRSRHRQVGDAGSPARRGPGRHGWRHHRQVLSRGAEGPAPGVRSLKQYLGFQGVNGAGEKLCDPRGPERQAVSGRRHRKKLRAEFTRAFLQVYDAGTNSWAIKTPLQFGVGEGAAAGAGGKVFYIAGRTFGFGGLLEFLPNVSEVHAYQP